MSYSSSRLLSWTILGLILCPVLAGPLLADIHDVPGDFDTIQEAIDSDDVVDGDEIILEAGVYVENIDFSGKAITITGAGVDETIIGAELADGTIDGSVVVFDTSEGADSILQGVTIRGGTGTTTTANWLGVGFEAEYGGGLFISSASPTIVDCLIEGNFADVGAGAYVQYGSPSFENCNFKKNDAEHGVGLYMHAADDVVLTDCQFEQNETNGGLGGGLLAYDCESLSVTGCAFSTNRASAGGGLYLYDGDSVFEETVVTNNLATGISLTGTGGGVVVDGATLSMSNSRLATNVADRGAGIVIDGGGRAELTRCLLYRNHSETNGGAILASVGADSIDLVNCTVTENTVGNTLDPDLDEYEGGAIYVPSLSTGADSDVEVTCRSSIFWDNGLTNEAIVVSATLSIDYCDVEGGSEVDGVDNIDEDPNFVSPLSSDFRLQYESPCIDSGDEDESDPDGSRADIGALPHVTEFLRGDIDGNGAVSAISDALALLTWQFGDGPAPMCMDSADVDDSGRVHGLVDAMAVLHWVYASGDEPPAPGPDECGEDPTDDDVDCDTLPICP